MSLLNNARIPAGAIRKPRLIVTINGKKVPGFIEAEVTNASHFTPDTFRLTAAASALPPQFAPSYWAFSFGDEIGISVGYEDTPGNITGETQLILGQVDDVSYDPVRRTVAFTGRDLSAPFLDTKTSEKFQNQKSYQIAQALAIRHGLDSQVQQTTALVGTYYEIDNVMLTQEQTEWDLLVFLAQQESFDLWVSGRTLYFQPPIANAATPYKLISPSPGNIMSNVVDIHVSRSQTLARDIIVKIQTWNQKQQKAFVVTYKVSQAYKSQRAGGKAQTYSFTVPNLTRDQALALAKSRAEDITRHECILEARLPGDNILTTRAPVQLIGTATAWDQIYYPDTVTRHISFERGYTMELRAKNHRTQSTVVLG